MFVLYLTLVLLVCLWWVGDQEFRTKLILTLVYAGLWGLGLLAPDAFWVTFAGMCLWCVVVGYWTFGKHFRK
jgi:hypothetical protein